jgi:diguanylate cyclase (GGDEF)-like protein/PAS domain S-box-containing protein
MKHDPHTVGPSQTQTATVCQAQGLASPALRRICSADAYARALDQVAIVAVTDTRGTIVYANEQFARISKYPQSELIGQDHRILNSGHHPTALFKQMYRTISRGDVWRGELRNRAKDGSFYWVDTWIIPARSARGKVVGYISIRVDITPRKQAEEAQQALNEELRRQNAAIAHMTTHDALTGLPNRLFLCARLHDALMGLSEGTGLSVLLIALDRFKDINDTLGHRAGDALLKLAAGRLRGCVTSRDTVARFGGHEFAVVRLAADPATEAAFLAARILEAMNAPFELDGRQISIGASIGISVPPNDGVDPDRLLKNADLALHRTKSDNPGEYRFFEVEMDRRMQARLQLELDLRKAVADCELELHYQPVLNLETKSVSGFEALLRWQHGKRGKVSPADFIPIAEETGLILSIGEWALKRACADAMQWPDHVRVAVNLSATQLRHGNLVKTVASALAESRLPGPRLELEITESLLVHHNELTLATLAELRHGRPHCDG